MHDTPWWTRAFMEWLENELRERKRIFEYGSGHSTIYLQDRAELVSIEHDIRWYERIRPEIKSAEYRLVHPEEYPESILGYERNFDIVIVDGIYRERCVRAALKKIKEGGYLILDDSEKTKYRAIKKMLSQYPKEIKEENGKETTMWKI